MKLPLPIEDDGMFLEEVNPCKAGVYCIFRIPNVRRGIRGKNKGQVDELLIVGVPWSRANDYLKKYGIEVRKYDE